MQYCYNPFSMDKLPHIDQSAKYHKFVKSYHYTYSDLRHLANISWFSKAPRQNGEH